MTFVRYGLPAGLVLAGFVPLFVADDTVRWDGFAMCVGAGLEHGPLARRGAEGLSH